MSKGVLKLAACCLAAGMTFTGTGTVAFASGTPIAGLGYLPGTEGLEVQPQSVEAQEADGEVQAVGGVETEAGQQVQEADPAALTQTESPAVSQETEVDTSLNGTMAFAKCDEYINIRSDADINGEVVGKIYNNGSATILGKVGDWYQVQTGNVTGYVNADYFAVGSEAQAIAEQVAYNVATVNAEALMIRSEPNEDSEAIDMAENSDELEVVQYEGDWMKVALGGDSYGYVNAYYVDYDTYYATGETLEEEQARLDAQWLAYLEEQEAAQEEQAAQSQVSYDGSYDSTYDSSSSDGTSAQDAYQAEIDAAYQEALQDYTGQPAATDGQAAATDAQAAADAAYQQYLDAQAAADAATQQADEQLVYDTAQTAQAAYQDFLDAQAVADAQAYGAEQPEDSYDSSSESYETYDETYSSGESYETYEEPVYSDSTSDVQAAADAAYQQYLDAQATADAATQQADEQLVYDTAAQAQEAYQEYLNAQAAADAAAAGQSADQAAEAAEIQAAADAAAAEQAAADAAAAEQAAADAAAAEQAAADAAAAEQAASSSGLGQQIVDFAVQFVGNPYVWGGTSLTDGADCSGFTQSVFANFGISIPRTAASQSGSGTPVDLGSIQPGDLLFYNGGSGIGHVTIYMGNGQVVHASNSTTGIIISDYGYRTPVSARRYW